MLHFPSSDIGMFGRRQKHARGHRVPVSIVERGAATRDGDVVIADEFGADDVVSLGTGCACCTVRGELQRALQDVLAKHERGRHVSRVMIETANDVAPVLRTFASERALRGAFYVEDAPPLQGTRFTLTKGAPLLWDMFSRFIATLVSLRGADLTHVQGVLNIEGCRGPVVVQYLQHLAHPPVELAAWPDGERGSRLTLVTRNVPQASVRALFDAMRALA